MSVATRRRAAAVAIAVAAAAPRHAGAQQPLAPSELPITVVDDTFDAHRDVMETVLARARQRAGI